MLQREEDRRPRVRREAGRTEQKKQESRTAGNIDRKLIEGMLKGESPKSGWVKGRGGRDIMVIILKTVYGGERKATGGYGEKDKAPRVITCVEDGPIWEDTALKASAETAEGGTRRRGAGHGTDDFP